MARGSLAPENELLRKLTALNCAPRNFCAITSFPYGSWTGIFNNAAPTRDLTSVEVERFDEFIGEMYELQADFNKFLKAEVPVDWAQAGIVLALTKRRVAKCARELGDDSFNTMASEATRAMERN
jgi:hypothetical protein